MKTPHARAAHIPIVLLLLVALTSSGRSQAPPLRVTLEEALQLFTENSLELRLARARAAEAAGLARQAGAYPNPEFIGTHESLDGTLGEYSETYFMLSQRIDWPGAVSARHSSAEYAALAALQEFRSDSARLAFEVKRAYVAAVVAEQRLLALERSTEVVRRVQSNGRARFEEGEISGYEDRRLSLERAGYENQLATAELMARQARRQFASLIAPESDMAEIAPAEPLADRAPRIVWTEAQAAAGLRPELATATARAESAEQAVLWTKRERIPDPILVGGYKTQSDGLEGLFVGLTLPLPLFDRLGGAVSRDEARARAATDRVALARRVVELDIRRAFESYESLGQRFELVSQILLADVERLLEVASLSYEGGELTLIEFLDAAETYRRARIGRAEFMGDYWISYFDLERAMTSAYTETNQDEAGNR